MAVNYAEQYAQALANAFPNVLHFGALYNTENNSQYKFIDANTIKVPVVKTGGRVDGTLDKIESFTRNYQNEWETKTLENYRKWKTLVPPEDIQFSNQVLSIQNITKSFNEFQKFPEMDAYCVSKIYADWVAQSKTASTTALTVDNVLSEFDKMMQAETEANTPEMGRILYVTPQTSTLIKQAKEVTRAIDIKDAGTSINRRVTDIDLVQVEVVPSELMKTAYDFTAGYKVGSSAQQINMMLIHPQAVITPVAYTYSQLDAPSAGSEGKYLYYEESYEDVFILNQRADAIQFNVTATA